MDSPPRAPSGGRRASHGPYRAGRGNPDHLEGALERRAGARTYLCLYIHRTLVRVPVLNENDLGGLGDKKDLFRADNRTLHGVQAVMH